MYHMIFEDNKKVPISELISYVYEDSDVKVHFSGGNRNIKSKLIENYDENDKYIIFFDLVPDNHTAINEYRKLKDFIDESLYDNVTIIPIPCIEYFVLKVIGKVGVSEIKIALNFGQYKSTDLCINLLRGRCKNFEAYCKKVLAHKTAICYRNENGEQYGAWYKGDCWCKKPQMDCDIQSRMIKGCKLISSLPIYYSTDGIKGHIEFILADEKAIQEKCIKKYKEVENVFREYGYIG